MTIEKISVIGAFLIGVMIVASRFIFQQPFWSVLTLVGIVFIIYSCHAWVNIKQKN